MTVHHGPYQSEHGLEAQGIEGAANVYWNLPASALYEHALCSDEGSLVEPGPLVVRTGDHTGRSPNDKLIVEEPTSSDRIWWGEVNRPMSEQDYQGLQQRMLKYIVGRDLFVFDGFAGADPNYRMPVRVISEYAWHNLFARNMFILPKDPEVLLTHQPQFTVLDLPGFQADSARDGTNSPTAIVVNFGEGLVLIARTQYAGEIKKSIFTAMNYELPSRNVLPMHCSANYGEDNEDVALFFGLSGTGKTTLSNVAERTLVGDDEHGWSDEGIFNMEGGCYAKVIRLDPEGEPLIFDAAHRYETILENVAIDSESRLPDLHDSSFTENTRASYPITHVANASPTGLAGHPKNIIFLTADAFGVLPPISRLTKDQAKYHFLSGYTAKVAGTERGVDEPRPVFSACFGAPFMPLPPTRYAELLGRQLDLHGAQVWLVNTGWTGGPYGQGHRIELAHTRRMVAAILTGELDDMQGVREHHFGHEIPARVEGVPAEVLDPKQTWSDPAAYDAQAEQLVELFAQNFVQFADGVTAQVRAAGPSNM